MRRKHALREHAERIEPLHRALLPQALHGLDLACALTEVQVQSIAELRRRREGRGNRLRRVGITRVHRHLRKDQTRVGTVDLPCVADCRFDLCQGIGYRLTQHLVALALPDRKESPNARHHR